MHHQECIQDYRRLKSRKDIKYPVDKDIPRFMSTDAHSWVEWLKKALGILHAAVRSNKLEWKEQMTTEYDRRNKTVEPLYKVGDWVLMKQNRIKQPDRVLTQHRCEGPFIIQNVVRHNEEVSAAYKLVDARTGRVVPRLVNVDKLRRFLQKDESRLDDTSTASKNN